jgi:DNA (cytosine-5)-methyltransferase 1
MSAHYNEIDPFAARWLRQLISDGHVAPGVVDERSIRDLVAADVTDAQQHFFAGIGGWAYALRLAGWPEDLPVWTGSCPCQPFSSAGRGRGFDDSRHLWPVWFELIRTVRPPIVFGEQVASPDGMQWLDLVQDDLEREGYSVGAVDLAAASVAAPHKRQRIYFVAYAHGEEHALHLYERRSYEASLATPWRSEARDFSVGDAGSSRGGRDTGGVPGKEAQSQGEGLQLGRVPDFPLSAGADSFWDDCEWCYHRDGKCRPIEPGTFPVADGVPARVGLIRGYGNAIVPQLAASFVSSAAEAIGITLNPGTK